MEHPVDILSKNIKLDVPLEMGYSKLQKLISDVKNALGLTFIYFYPLSIIKCPKPIM